MVKRQTHMAEREGGSRVEVAPATDPKRSTSRPRVPDAVPTAWLDRLLVAAIDLPLARGERAVLRAVLESVAAILPNYAVGASWSPEPGRPLRDRVVLRLPASVSAPAPEVDPTRIFPLLAHEYVTPIPGAAAGSTLHLASDADALGTEGAAAVHLLDRAAIVLGRALSHARAVAGAPRGAHQFETRMIQADKLATFGQLAAGLVHELNNPLTSIVAYSEYLTRKALSDGSIADAEDIDRLRRISESAHRMLRFTRELVNYTRPSSGARAAIVVHDVIDQAVAFCEHVLAGAGVSVERRYGGDALRIQGVSEKLVQVFVNLLTNACQAARADGGRVVLTTSPPPAGGEGRVEIVVADNGSGIADEHLPNIFVPFFTTRRDGNGTGLGLSIVKSIVESHDGVIRVETRPGEGTDFVITFPVLLT